jgi:hypothetical protein
VAVDINYITDVYRNRGDSGKSVAYAKITNTGGNYSNEPTITFEASTSGTTTTGTAMVRNKHLAGITITNAGSGYTEAPNISVTGPGEAEAVLSPYGYDFSEYGHTNVLILLSDDHTGAITVDASTQSGSFQKYTITSVDWNTTGGDIVITFTGTGSNEAITLPPWNSGNFNFGPIENNATQPGDDTDADIILTPSAACNGYVYLELKKVFA